jgi:hypothetical protein
LGDTIDVTVEKVRSLNSLFKILEENRRIPISAMASTTKWMRFCGEDGNTNIIKCPNCGATNPILRDYRTPPPGGGEIEHDVIDIDAIQPRRARPSGSRSQLPVNAFKHIKVETPKGCGTPLGRLVARNPTL